MAYVNGAPSDPARAVEFYLELIKSRPDCAEAYYDLAQIVSAHSGDMYCTDSLPLWQQAFNSLPAWPQFYPEWSLTLRTMGGILMHKGDKIEEGRDLIRQALEIQDAIASQHPIGKQGIRILSNLNVPQHFGHSCLEPEMLVKLGVLGWRKPITPILLMQDHVANRHLMSYWADHFEVVSDTARVRDLLPLQRWLWLDSCFVTLPDGRTLQAEEAMASINIEWQRQGREPVLKLRSEDYERGWKALQELGVPKGAWFVTVHAREAGYYNEPTQTQSNRFRNVDVETYRLALNTIVEHGGWVIRVGDPTMVPLPPMPNTIDYVHTALFSDWMNVFLAAECRFFLGSESGAMNLPSLFGRPCGITNWLRVRCLPCYAPDVFILKLPWLASENRYLSLPELGRPPFSTASSDRLQAMGLAPKPNTPEEIRDLALEMLEQTGPGTQLSEEDKRLQALAREVFDSPFSSRSPCRLGRDFLRSHKELLFQGVCC